ncbi:MULTISPECIES: hypothetical protein [unclassified Bradyrhizobium]|uniref:hypothetical protein n=1 Tax=unclassified Bradyrhizobium TaxID=2631580 RepID=UPI001FF86864|nr:MULTISPECIES: hypothetical protein [unclassified Bradyrhizobium]MCK1533160.1 hypothetical protein [Bradyrhizobium sp. 176]MCK1558268.1 hypothetical protein [Bradyrhizobium sp. 171]
MIEALLFAAAIECNGPCGPAPRLNPQVCTNLHRTGSAFIVMKETWILPALKLREGQRLRYGGPEGMVIGGWNLIDLIEKTCNAPAS